MKSVVSTQRSHVLKIRGRKIKSYPHDHKGGNRGQWDGWGWGGGWRFPVATMINVGERIFSRTWFHAYFIKKMGEKEINRHSNQRDLGHWMKIGRRMRGTENWRKGKKPEGWREKTESYTLCRHRMTMEGTHAWSQLDKTLLIFLSKICICCVVNCFFPVCW